MIEGTCAPHQMSTMESSFSQESMDYDNESCLISNLKYNAYYPLKRAPYAGSLKDIEILLLAFRKKRQYFHNNDYEIAREMLKCLEQYVEMVENMQMYQNIRNG